MNDSPLYWNITFVIKHGASPVAQSVKNLPAMQEMRVQSLGGEDPLEKGMATHSSIHAWEIPWTEEPGGLQSMGSQTYSHIFLYSNPSILKPTADWFDPSVFIVSFHLGDFRKTTYTSFWDEVFKSASSSCCIPFSALTTGPPRWTRGDSRWKPLGPRVTLWKRLSLQCCLFASSLPEG